MWIMQKTLSHVLLTNITDHLSAVLMFKQLTSCQSVALFLVAVGHSQH